MEASGVDFGGCWLDFFAMSSHFGTSWAGFLAPKSLPGGEQGTPRKTNPTVQLFNLISFLEALGGSWAGFRLPGAPGLDYGLKVIFNYNVVFLKQ